MCLWELAFRGWSSRLLHCCPRPAGAPGEPLLSELEEGGACVGGAVGAQTQEGRLTGLCRPQMCAAPGTLRGVGCSLHAHGSQTGAAPG